MSGEGYTEYEIGGFIFRVGPPRIICREEGGQTFVRVEYDMQTIPPPAKPEGPSEPSQGAG